MATIEKRINVQLPIGQAKAIREAAARSGMPLRTFVTQLILRGFTATEQQSISEQLHEVTVAIERNTQRVEMRAGGESRNPEAEVTLKALAAIFARVQLIGGKLDLESAKVEALAATTFKTLAGRG